MGFYNKKKYPSLYPIFDSAASQTSSIPTKSSFAELDAEVIINDQELPHQQFDSCNVSISDTIQKQRQHGKRHDSNSVSGSVGYTAYHLNDSVNLVEELRNVGVTVLSLDISSTNAMKHYLNAVCTMKLGSESEETCILYTDQMGRLFNVVLSGGAKGLATRYKIVQDAYTGWLSMFSLVWIIHVTTAAITSSSSDHLQKLSLALTFVVGWILEYETCLTWLFTSLSVRGTNSVGAYVWRSPYSSLIDYPRYLTLIACILGCIVDYSSDHMVPNPFLLVACGMTMAMLLSNLGSCAWKKLNFPKLDSNYFGSFIVVQVVAILFGTLFGFVACIPCSVTGQRARLHITLLSFLVAVCIVLTEAVKWWDDEYDDHIIAIVHNTLTIWWIISTVASYLVCNGMEKIPVHKMEPFLQRDETSPVGWIVPCIPNVIMKVGWKPSETSLFTNLISLALLISMGGWLVYEGVLLITKEGRTAFWEVY